MKEDSDSDMSQQINDQLNQLWTNAKDKRKELLSHLTSYSKRNKPSLNSSLQPKGYGEDLPSGKLNRPSSNSAGLEKEVIRLREQLEMEVFQGRHKEIELDRLKKTAEQLAIDKQYLARQLHETLLPDENNSKTLNQSSILPRSKSNKKGKHCQGHSLKQPKRTMEQQTITRIDGDFSKDRLVELVRSTSEYRSFVFYYDSNELSYLRRLNQQHKKNREKAPGEKEKQFWAPSELVERLKHLNLKQELNLSQKQIEKMILRLKTMFQANEAARLQKLRQSLQGRLKKSQRASQNRVPYELVQIAKARERELSRWSSTKRSTSLFR